MNSLDLSDIPQGIIRDRWHEINRTIRRIIPSTWIRIRSFQENDAEWKERGYIGQNPRAPNAPRLTWIISPGELAGRAAHIEVFLTDDVIRRFVDTPGVFLSEYHSEIRSRQERRKISLTQGMTWPNVVIQDMAHAVYRGIPLHRP